MSENDLGMVLLNMCVKMSTHGKIGLVAAVIANHARFELCAVIKEYLTVKGNIFMDSMHENKETQIDEDWDEFEENFSDNDSKELLDNDCEDRLQKYAGMVLQQSNSESCKDMRENEILTDKDNINVEW